MISSMTHPFFNGISISVRERLMKVLRIAELNKHMRLKVDQPWFILTGAVGGFDEEVRREVVVLNRDDAWLGANLPCLSRLNVRLPGAALTCSWVALKSELGTDQNLFDRVINIERERVVREAYDSLAYSILEDVRVEHRVARYLTQFKDRDLDFTQISIANAVGVRREGVTAAVTRLEQLGLIVHQRSYIDIVDLKGLRAFVHSVIPH